MTPHPATPKLLDFVFAEVWQRPGLSRRDRRFVTLPCVAAADAEGPLRDHVYAALNSGDVTITEMRETVLHFAVYSGWPKASRFNMIVDEQWERIHRERGQAVPPPEPLLPLTTPSDPEARLPSANKRSATSTACRTCPTRDNPYSGRGHPELRLRRDVAAAGTGDEGTTAGDRGVRGVSGRAVPDPEPRLRRVEEPRHLVRRNGRTGLAFRGLLRLGEGLASQRRDRRAEATRARGMADRSGASSPSEYRRVADPRAC